MLINDPGMGDYLERHAFDNGDRTDFSKEDEYKVGCYHVCLLLNKTRNYNYKFKQDLNINVEDVEEIPGVNYKVIGNKNSSINIRGPWDDILLEYQRIHLPTLYKVVIHRISHLNSKQGQSNKQYDYQNFVVNGLGERKTPVDIKEELIRLLDLNDSDYLLTLIQRKVSNILNVPFETLVFDSFRFEDDTNFEQQLNVIRELQETDVMNYQYGDDNSCFFKIKVDIKPFLMNNKSLLYISNDSLVWTFNFKKPNLDD